MGRSARTGNVCLFTENNNYSYPENVDDIKNGWKAAEDVSHVDHIDEKNVDPDETNIIS